MNNLVEQDHCAVKHITRPMLGFKSFRCARAIIAGIDLMHMIRKGQLKTHISQAASAVEHFDSLTG